MNEEKKYVSYLRLSKDGGTGLGIEAQRSIIKHFYPDVVQEFTELKSARNITERPVLNEAITFCLANDAVLIVAKTDRLSRRTEDGLYVLSKLDNRLICCDIPGERVDKFILTLFLAIASRELELISIRTKQALAENKRRGKLNGQVGKNNLTNEGRRKGRESQRQASLDNPNHRRAIALIRELKNQGLSLRDIAKRLNDNNYLTSMENDWSAPSVGALLKRASV